MSASVFLIESSGFWLLADGREYFVPFSDYPVFGRATVEQIFAVEQVAPGQLRWQALDADIELDALDRPDDFPLIWKE